jgi:voltage-gated potassium channel
MKFLATQISYFLSQGRFRKNINALFKYLLFLIAVIIIFTVLFHLIMFYAEGRRFSWVTGLYWTLSVMSTLGFGDITFQSDTGRAFTVVVLMSGIILLLIMLPFAFIKFFYAPWLEAQLHTQTPREVPPDTEGHVIICRYDSIAPNLIKRLVHNQIPYFVIEPDAAAAAHLYQEGVSVIHGEVDSSRTYRQLRVDRARLVFANAEDTINTNITLTVKEVAPDVTVAAVAAAEDSIDILTLSGADHVLPLKQTLGRHLANRISVGRKQTNVIGKFSDWLVVEFTVHDTPLKGKKIRETGIREKTGVNIIGIWERGHLSSADPDKTLQEFSVPVGVGTKKQINKLERLLSVDAESEPEAVLVIGGGSVGCAAVQALKKKNLEVFLIDRKKELRETLGGMADRLTIGDAADRETLTRGGLNEVSLVILSTNDDAVNIYLTVYCRRLNPDLRIVSRITHERNLEAIHRAGADFVLSYAPLGAESVISILQQREPVIMGEGVEFFTINLPKSLAGKTLAESGIGSLTGLVVLAIQNNGQTIASPTASTVLPEGSRLNALGTTEQLGKFKSIFQ